MPLQRQSLGWFRRLEPLGRGQVGEQELLEADALDRPRRVDDRTVAEDEQRQLAVAVALDPTLVETRRAAVDVETTGRLTTGATVVDWRGQWGRLANTEVAVAVDADRFRRLFFDAMARLADGAGRD